MSKKPKQPEEKKPDVQMPNLNAEIAQMAYTGADFKTKVLQNLVKHTAMPMLVFWYDNQLGLCTAIGNDLRMNEQVRKSVGMALFKIVADLKLFEGIATKAD